MGILRNILFVLILILLFTGGIWYKGDKVFVELSQLNGFVAALLLFVVIGLRKSSREAMKGEWWYKKITDWINRFAGFQQSHPYRTGLMLAFGFGFILSIVAVKRHMAFETNAFDLGVMYDPLWNTLNGRLHYSSLSGDLSRFLIHVEPIAFLLLPLIYIWETPATLLVIQAFALGLSIIPVVLLARKKLESPLLQAAVIISYTAFFPLRKIALFDYHHVSLAVPCLLFALYFLETKKLGRYFLFLILAMATKETVALPVMFLALVILTQKRWGTGLATGIIGVAAFVVGTKIIPSMFEQTFRHLGLYEHLGGSMVNVALSPILMPGAFFKEMLAPEVFQFLFLLFAPVAFICFLCPLWLLPGFPVFMFLALAEGSQKISVDYHYTSELIPFVYFALICSVAKLEKKIELNGNWGFFHSKRAVAFVLIAAAFLFFGRSPVAKFRMMEIDDHKRHIKQIVRTIIPPNASVAANSCIVPHLMNREGIYLVPRQPVGVDYVLFDTSLCPWPIKKKNVMDYVIKMDESSYDQIYKKDKVIIWKRFRVPDADGFTELPSEQPENSVD